ncbi:MAG: hypothetical protein A2V66_00505 [Ignavibacteria bacterium RBG_13_36_8]|nr:MAG: hypothetical protein A2V66_00505 [Ignavibacteria bacterium RBG_13_36_8]
MNTIFRSTVRGIAIYIISVCLSNIVLAQSGGDEIAIGKSFQLKSKIFNEERTILVYLPEDYENSENKYPVLYLLDGYDHFHYVSGMVLSLSRSRKIPRMIVVGIQNPHRNRDFTPRPIKDLPGSGSAEKFLQFAEEELFTFIDKNYRTEPCRILMGHSLCGMFALYTLFTDPELFNGLIAVSPAVWLDDKYVLEYAKQKLDDGIELNNFLYFTIGGNESKDSIKAAEEFKNLLTQYSPEGLDWEFQLIKDEGHFTVVPPSIFKGLKYIFSRLNTPDEIQNGELDEIIEYFEQLTKKFRYEIKPPEELLNRTGYRYLNAGNIYDAIDTFNKSIELYPNSANAYNSLGEAYETNNQLELAKEFYEKAYQIGGKNRDPNLYYYMQDYENILKKLKK